MGAAYSSGGGFYGGGLDDVLSKLNDVGSDNEILKNYVEKVGQLCQNASRVGDGNAVGGAKETKSMVEYANSVHSKQKDDLIRNIAADVFEVLKINTNLAKTGSIDTIIDELSKLIPDPRKNIRFNKEFNNSPGKQLDVCKAIANAVNKNYGGNIINMNVEPNEMCNQVAEVLYSLFTGLHTEFVSVAADITRTLKNMMVIDDVLDSSYAKLNERYRNTGDEAMRQEAESSKQLYDDVKKELNRQMAILSNLVNVALKPETNELISAVMENKDFAGLTKDIRADLGTNAFADKLSMLLSGVSSVAYSAQLISKALNKIGMSVQDFKSSKTPAELRQKVYKKLAAVKDSGKLDKLLLAAEVIFKNNYDHEAVSEALGKTGGGYDDNVDGGADDAPYWRQKSLSQKIEKKSQFRDMVLKDFRKLLQTQYKLIVESASRIGPKIGNGIKITDQLHSFVDSFSVLPNLDKEKIAAALSGYAKDSVSKQEREKFINGYKTVLSAIESLPKESKNDDLDKLASQISELLKMLEDFAENMVKAITDINVAHPADLDASVKRILGGGLLSDSEWVEFNKVKNELYYYYTISNIKENISRTLNDSKDYEKEYSNILGEEAGMIINNIKKEFGLLIDVCNRTNTAALVAGTRAARLNDLITSSSAVADDTETTEFLNSTKRLDVILKNLATILREQMNAKIELVKVAQAVDLYMKAFTNAVMSNPDHIKDILKVIDQVDMVAKWFNEKSGDNLAMLFECFPTGFTNADINYYGTAADTRDSDAVIDANGKINSFIGNGHYYNKVVESVTGVGNPFLGRLLTKKYTNDTQLKSLMGLSDKSIKSVRALENIISAFVSIGDKYGDVDIESKTFMKAGEMFNGLCNYMRASAFSTYFAPTAENNSAAAELNIGYSTNETSTHTNANMDKLTSKIKSHCIPMGIISDRATLNSAGTNSRLTSNLDANGLLFRQVSSIALAGIPNDTGNFWDYHDLTKRVYHTCLSGWADDFYDTDLLFMMTIKSIVAKIFTVLDVYKIFHRPTIDRRSYFSLNPTRMMIGGGADDLKDVKVVPEALELYYRLPLLAEWYRENFGFKNLSANLENYRLVVPPSLDGIWSDLMEIIFDKARGVEDGNYSENQVKRLVVSINNIWKVYNEKVSGVTTRQIVNAFVVDVNRAFGFMKEKDIEAYNKERRKYLDESTYDSVETLDFDILGTETRFGSRTAPSDRFVNINDPKGKKVDANAVIFMKEIYELREKIDKDFQKFLLDANTHSGNKMHTRLSFSNSMRNYLNDIKVAKSENEKYNVVLKMIQGADRIMVSDVDKLLMVHEVVAAPLAGLMALYLILYKVNVDLHTCCYSVLKSMPTGEVNTAFSGGVNTDANTLAGRADLKKFLLQNAKETKITHDGNTYSGKFEVDCCINILNYVGINGANYSLSEDYLVSSLVVATKLIQLSANSGGLIEFSTGTSGNINIDFSKVKELAYQLLSQVKSNITKLRTLFNAENSYIVDKYETLSSVGSARWLEENLLEVLINNRDENGLDHGVLAFKQQMKTYQETKLSSAHTYAMLALTIAEVDRYNARGTIGTPNDLDNVLNMGLSADLNKFPFNIYQFKSKPDVTNEAYVSKFKDLKLATGFSVAEGVALNTYFVAQRIGLCNKDFGNLIFGIPQTSKSTGGRQAIRAGKVTDTNGNMFNGFVSRFNEILKSYIVTNLDESSNKIYHGLLNSFMNSSAAYEINQKKSNPDLFRMFDIDATTGEDVLGARGLGPKDFKNTNTRLLRLPKENSIIYSSSAMAIYYLMNTVNTRTAIQKKTYLYENISEIPDFIKEKMKANLPYLIKMLDNLNKEVSSFLQLHNNTNPKYNIEAADALHFINGTAAGLSTVRVHDTLVTTENTEMAIDWGSNTLYKMVEITGIDNYVNVQLTKVMTLCQSLIKTADLTLKELSDVPYYFMETSKDFIIDYKSKNGVLPLMPSSNLLSLVRSDPLSLKMNELLAYDSPIDQEQPFYILKPTRAQGSSPYRFNVSVKSLLSRDDVEPKLELMPGVQEIYNSYFMRIQAGDKISTDEYSNTINMFVKLMRCVGTIISYNTSFTSSWDCNLQTFPSLLNLQSGTNFIYATNARQLTNLDALKQNMTVSALCNELPKVLSNIEYYNVSQNKKNVIDVLGEITNNSIYNREFIRTANIIDMNIVPLNFHALMREVPFVNLINYSYTFDKMVHDFVLPNISEMMPSGEIMIKNDTQTVSTRTLLVKLLTYPYARLSDDDSEYYSLLGDMFNGNDSLNLGRPRYLSDQLWNKVLLNTSHFISPDNTRYSNLPAAENASGEFATRTLIKGGTIDYNTIVSGILNKKYYMMHDTYDTLTNDASRDSIIWNNNTSGGGSELLNFLYADGRIQINERGNNVGLNEVSNLITINTDIRLGGKSIYEIYSDFINKDIKDIVTDRSKSLDSKRFLLRVLAHAANTGGGNRVVDFDARVGSDASVGDPELDAIVNAGVIQVSRTNVKARIFDIAINYDKAADAKVDNGLGETADIFARLKAHNNKYSESTGVEDITEMSLKNMIYTLYGITLAGDASNQPYSLYHKFTAAYATAGTLKGAGDLANAASVATLLGRPAPDSLCNEISKYVENTAVQLNTSRTKSYADLRGLVDSYEDAKILFMVNALFGRDSAGTHTVNDAGASYFKLNGTNRSVDNTTNTIISANEETKPGLLLIPKLTEQINTSAANVADHIKVHLANFLAYIVKDGLYKNVPGIGVNTLSKMTGGVKPTKPLTPYVGVTKPVMEGLKIYDKQTNQWVDPKDKNDVKVHLTPEQTYKYAEIGRMRFDTKLVRNLTWMVNLQRVMRAMINRHISHIEASVIRGLPIADNKVTEYSGNENYDDDDFDVKQFVAL